MAAAPIPLTDLRSPPDVPWLWRVVLLTLVGLVALGTEQMVGAFARRFNANETYLAIRHHLAYVESPTSEPVDVLVLGDSSSLRVDSALIGPAVHATAGNLGHVAQGALMVDAYLLERYLQTHRPPRLVLLVHAVQGWRMPLQAEIYAAHFNSVSETATLVQRGVLTPLQAVRLAVMEALPSYRYKPTLERLAKMTLTNGVGWLRQQYEANGGSPTPRRPLTGGTKRTITLPDAVARSLAHVCGTLPEHFSLSPSNAYFLKWIDALAVRHGFRVFVVYGPQYEGLLCKPAAHRYVAELERELPKRCAALVNTEVLLSEVPAFALTEMYNTVEHLNKAGGTRYSKSIAQALRDRVGSGGGT